MLAASAYYLMKSHVAISGGIPALAVGFVVSFITAIIAIKSFLSFLKRRDFTFFGWYRIAVAIAYFAVFIAPQMGLWGKGRG